MRRAKKREAGLPLWLNNQLYLSNLTVVKMFFPMVPGNLNSFT